MELHHSLAGRGPALVTGGSRGIGAAIVLALARAGFDIWLNYRADEAAAARVSEQVRAETGRSCRLLRFDVRDRDAVEATLLPLTEEVVPAVLVNNAGVGMSSPVGAIDYEKGHQLFEVNFWGALRMTEAVLPDMRARQDGLIINISSIVGRRAMPGIGVYCASKAALNAFSESIRVELKQDNIRVVSFYPGVTATHFGDNLLTGPSSIQGKGRAKVTSAEDVGKAIVKAAIKEPRDAYATFFDRVFVWTSVMAPWLMDRVLLHFRQS